MKPSPVEGDEDQTNLPEGFHCTLMSLVALPGCRTAVPSMCSSFERPLLVSVAETWAEPSLRGTPSTINLICIRPDSTKLPAPTRRCVTVPPVRGSNFSHMKSSPSAS